MNNLDYGIIGNCKSAALISKHGSIDWCCLPNFDSPSVFAKILDEKIGGSFGFEVDDNYEISQYYLPGTNILVTRFDAGDDIFEVKDFMPRYYSEGKIQTTSEIIRYISLIKGRPRFKVKYDPRLIYAREKTVHRIPDDYLKSHTIEERYESVYLYTDLDKEKVAEGREIVLEKDSFFIFSYLQKLLEQNIDIAFLKFQNTYTYWLNWNKKTTIYKKYNDIIQRSALTLKLLTYDKSGAVLAAATTSLPETIGEVRNWDYRFCWIRDASMVINVVSDIGHTKSAHNFLKYIINIIPDKGEKMQIMYGINGETKLTEHILDHLSGYEGSSPVRVGNAAYEQKQNDIFGILTLVIYQQFLRFKTSLDYGEELWTIVNSIVYIVEENWQKPDKGIWELRTEDRHFTFSKLLCWVAIDRAIKIGELIGKTRKLEKWDKLRQAIYDDIYEKAWNEEVQAYTQYYGSKDLDASTLRMLEYGFVTNDDERFIKTVHATERDLCEDGLLYRYTNEDDFGKASSSFTICSFWFIESLYKIGEKKKAFALFNRILKYSNHLGLYSEDIDFKSKRLLGNFPQAYSHLALIETAILLSGGEDESENYLK